MTSGGRGLGRFGGVLCFTGGLYSWGQSPAQELVVLNATARANMKVKTGFILPSYAETVTSVPV